MRPQESSRIQRKELVARDKVQPPKLFLVWNQQLDLKLLDLDGQKTALLR